MGLYKTMTTEIGATTEEGLRGGKVYSKCFKKLGRGSEEVTFKSQFER